MKNAYSLQVTVMPLKGMKKMKKYIGTKKAVWRFFTRLLASNKKLAALKKIYLKLIYPSGGCNAGVYKNLTEAKRALSAFIEK